MAVTAVNAFTGIPRSDGCYVIANASGTALEVNPGDFVSWSGNYIIASHDGVTYWKASGLGVALDRNPRIDEYGNKIVNTALLVSRYGQFRVSANFSGQPALGVLAFPDMTGSGVNSPTGLTGLGAVWNTAAPTAAIPQQVTYDYRDLYSAISAYIDSSASGSALLPASGLLSANMASALNKGVAQVVGWYNSGPGGTGQLDIVLWDRNADYY